MLIAQTGSALVTSLALLVLAGWGTGIPAITSFGAGYAPMSVPTALLFIMAGLAVTLLTLPQRNRKPLLQLRLALAATILVLGGYALLHDLGLIAPQSEQDGLIFGPHMGKIAFATTLNFFIFGIALFMGRSQSAKQSYALLMLTGLIITSLATLGYTYDVETLYTLTTFNAMTLPTTIGFTLLFLSALLARPDAGWTQRLLASDSGGATARRILPAVILVPFIIAWAATNAVEHNMFAAPFGFAVVAVACAILLGFITYLASAGLAVRDNKLVDEVTLRRRAQNRLGIQVERLNLLNRITQAIGEKQDLSSIYQVVIRTLEDQMPIDFAAICKYDPVHHCITVQNVGVKSMPLAREMLMQERARIDIDENGLSQCVKGRLIYEGDISQSIFPFPRRLAASGLQSVVLSPLLNEGAVFGVLIVARLDPEAFSSGDCEFLGQLSRHVALASQQAQLHSNLRQAYDDLRQTQLAAMQRERLRALGQMASGIAHDINNAISPISIHTQSLLENKENFEQPMQDYLQMVGRQTDDVAATIERLREFYRERENDEETSPVNLNTIAQDVIEISRARWSDMAMREGKTITIATDFAADLPLVAGKDNELREAAVNLIFNAVDALPDGGKIRIRTKSSQDITGMTGNPQARYAVLEISDNGVGMDEDTARRCMEPFYTTKGERGTGLGLAMVYGVLKRHDAHMDIKSIPGKGTTVSLVFPAPASIKAQTPQNEKKMRPDPMRLLLIDDDPYVLDSLCAVLALDNHAIVGKTGAQEAIAEFEQALTNGLPFDVVITDLGMPYMDGNQVAQAIKTISPDTPVIMLTGWGQRLGDEQNARDHVDHVLAKPPKLAKLRETLVLCQS